jgi:hypothetical protein
MNETCRIGNNRIAKMAQECLSGKNIWTFKNYVQKDNFLLFAEKEVNKMDICEIETTLYFFRFKRNGYIYEDIDVWKNRIIGGKDINDKIIKYISMLLSKYNSINKKCSHIHL